MNSVALSPTLALTYDLIARPSITPTDAGCQAKIAEHLTRMGFSIQNLPFGKVTNLWARRGTQTPLFVFAGHTDVVPPGPLEAWRSAPFEPTLCNGYLYGRGVADMKGSLAAMVIACERFLATTPKFPGSLGFLITSDEEGPARDGTAKVMAWLNTRGEKIDYTLVGEPSSHQVVGDTIKHGRRGSLSAHVIFEGIQGHIAYPETTKNPIHTACVLLSTLVTEQWDKEDTEDSGRADFPPTGFQISNIHAGTGTTNVVPGTLEVDFNFRYSTALTHQAIQSRVETLLNRSTCQYRIDWQHSGKPFLTHTGHLLAATERAITAVMGIKTERSTAGGTSDGRFIAPHGSELIELGPINTTIHQINECVPADSLDKLTDIYQAILEELYL